MNRTGRQKERATPGRPLLVDTGRDDWIRTSDPLLPKQRRTFGYASLPCAYVPDRTSSKGVPGWYQRVVSFDPLIILSILGDHGWMRKNIVILFNWGMTPKAFIHEVTVFTVRCQLGAFPSCKTPSASVRVFFRIF